jgi:transcriptional regulator with XRE-family HTH domain
MPVREKIRLLRLSRKWTQEYIAEKLGMSPHGYGALERGDSKIDTERLEEIAQLFELPTSELYDADTQNIFNSTGTNKNNTNTHNLIGNTPFQINVYSAEYVEIKNKLIECQNEEIVALRKIIKLLENAQS